MSDVPCKFGVGDCVRDTSSGDWGYVKRADLLPGGWVLMIGGGAGGGMVGAHEMDLEFYDPEAPRGGSD